LKQVNEKGSMNHLHRAGHQTTLEEEAMTTLTEKPKPVDPFRHELENATISQPDWALDNSMRKPDDADGKVIPRFFIDAVLEVIAKTIEKVLAEVMARCVAEGVEKKLRPLTEEIALLRIAVENDWDRNRRRRAGEDVDVDR
jgi:hypothetical protein